MMRTREEQMALLIGAVELDIQMALDAADELYQVAKVNDAQAWAAVNLLAALRTKDGAVKICKTAMGVKT